MTEQLPEHDRVDPESTIVGRHRPAANPQNLLDGEELWESVVPGAVWVTVTNKRDEQESRSVGQGQVLRITTRDREICQDAIRDPKHDPFTNGMLRRVDADQNEDPRTESIDAMGMDELIAVFAKTGPQFERKISSLGEIPIRRLRGIAEDVDATHSQIQFLDQIIAERYSSGGNVQPSYRELEALGQVATNPQ